MSHFIRTSVAAVGLCGAGAILYRCCWTHRPSPEHKKELLRLSAVALSSEVVDTVLFRDGETLKLLRRFVKDVGLHPDTVGTLKSYVKEEFTTNKETVGALRKFVVEDIICDTWVRDELISMSKETGKEIIQDPAIYPGLSMHLLASAAQEGLQTPAFKDALRCALRSAFWVALVGFSPEFIFKEMKNRNHQ
ncbi:hypothetical protein C3747_28g44 [Trypanosoma cruzi]|uniref:Uncharacterized protein n=2 Tax=Trypanosoma cruzi TaxID=5693 RepID=Q4DCP4_TRYCC|nr:hypothetical protein, conserved [Trypanosoma cruzi]EAN90298.1 hypothetical protein, conserved [Trypanosoma cruzi]KAF8295009.1 hypothetical protein TcYC6_0098190 [Trypanosoma cruzi]PWV15598.1 hypothetical protein C3747_28g44 [Trypanosoma cruzi]RNC61290.1 hypothetical protein TcCL_ESM01056 [Trypanosoma cruzi]|eukprot:XP_812149.1 hypothetical protein [Trypanosoma cruzi strain CL Brener]